MRAGAEDEQTGLRRAVTPAMLLLFVVGDMVGGGIHALVGEVGGRVGGALWTGFALALLLALFTAGSSILFSTLVAMALILTGDLEALAARP